jgi:hypothetical protein
MYRIRHIHPKKTASGIIYTSSMSRNRQFSGFHKICAIPPHRIFYVIRTSLWWNAKWCLKQCFLGGGNPSKYWLPHLAMMPLCSNLLKEKNNISSLPLISASIDEFYPSNANKLGVWFSNVIDTLSRWELKA